jgi:hypothetical protein
VELVPFPKLAGIGVFPQPVKPYSKQSHYRSAEALRHPKAIAKASFSAGNRKGRGG